MAQILKLILLRFWPLIVGLQLPLFLLLHFPSSTHSQQQFQPSHRQQKWINAQIHPSELIIAQQPQRRSALEPSSNRQLLQPRQISALAHGLPPQHRAKIRGYKTNQRSERQTTIVIDCSAPHNGQCDAGTNFNPALAGGIRGAPGIKARLNPRAFQYLSTIFGGILNYMIKRARLPTISQCLPAPISGCINVYNLYVSRYRCPQRVTVYPNPPNQIVVDVQNLDVGVTGNLGGQINILIPIALFGIVQVNAHQVSVRVAVTIVNGPDGGPRIQMVSCAASVGYVDVYIQNGGLIGDIANSQLRGKISEMVRQQIPGQLCQRLPGILDSEINSKISGLIPRFIPVSKLLEIAVNAFGLGNLLGGTGQCPASCNFRKAAALGTAQKGNSTVLVLPPHLQLEQKMKLSNFNGSENKNGEILTRQNSDLLAQQGNQMAIFESTIQNNKIQFEKCNEERESQNKRVFELEQQIREELTKNSKLERERKHFEHLRNQIEEQYGKLKNELDGKNAQIDELETKLAEKRTKLEAANVKIGHLQEDCTTLKILQEQMKRDYREQITKQQNDIEKLLAEIEQKNSQIQFYEHQLAIGKEEIEQLKCSKEFNENLVQERNQKIEEIQREMESKINEQKEIVLELEKYSKQIERELEGKENELQNKNSEIGNFVLQIEELKKEKGKFEMKLNQITEINGKKKQTFSQYSDLEKETQNEMQRLGEIKKMMIDLFKKHLEGKSTVEKGNNEGEEKIDRFTGKDIQNVPSLNEKFGKIQSQFEKLTEKNKLKNKKLQVENQKLTAELKQMKENSTKQENVKRILQQRTARSVSNNQRQLSKHTLFQNK